MPGKLLIVSHTPHYHNKAGELYGWAPTVRENEYLGKLFEQIEVIGVLHQGSPPPSMRKYQNQNITFSALPVIGGHHLTDKLKLLLQIPKMMNVLNQSIKPLKNTDFIYVRSPCHIALLACFRLMFTKTPKRWFKYAGNWQPEKDAALSYTIQRALLRNNFGHGKVTVNDVANNNPSHILSVYNPCMTLSELKTAKELSLKKPQLNPLSLLFVGNLLENKGWRQLLSISKELQKRNIEFKLNIVGDGPDLLKLNEAIRNESLNRVIQVTGSLSQEQVFLTYANSHILLLPSRSEGWPKVVSEAMAHGCVPLVSDVSCLKAVLEPWHAGIALPLDDTRSWSDAIQLLSDENEWKRYSHSGIDHADSFTYECMLEIVEQKIVHAS